eukprot:TRINITY_DN298_c0_g1_i1.p1 TRINITY_DN298_c0_g1~~TRINITY_DN298_c0_g1_i1.p1  ORF type:complete len:418 (+),score=79.57 TRINITY_DN298_c0_g1_i1:107-1360(+)
MSLKANSQTLTELMKLYHANNFTAAIPSWLGLGVPLNAVYADKEGNIGYWATGSAPIRSKGYSGDIPVPGWTGEYEWEDYVPPELMPHGFNPSSGYYVTANNKLVDDNFPFFLGRNWVHGYRGRRITDLVEEKIDSGKKITIKDVQKITGDVKSLVSVEFVEMCKKYEKPVNDLLDSNGLKLAWKKLLSFDGFITKESVGASLYHTTRYYAIYVLLQEVLGTQLTRAFLGDGVNPVVAPVNEFRNYDIIALLRMFKNESSVWMQKAGGPVVVLKKSLERSVRWLSAEVGKDLNSWKWGTIHTVTANHLLGFQPPLEQIFNVGPFPIDGDTDCPMNSPVHAAEPYILKGWSTHYRQCFDMGSLSDAEVIHFPGQSGNIGSKHYDDFVETWLDKGFHRLFWDYEDVLANKERELVLVPK